MQLAPAVSAHVPYVGCWHGCLIEHGPWRGFKGYLKAAGSWDVPYSHSAVHGGAEQPARILADDHACHSVLVALEAPHHPHCLNIVPAQGMALPQIFMTPWDIA